MPLVTIVQLVGGQQTMPLFTIVQLTGDQQTMPLVTIIQLARDQRTVLLRLNYDPVDARDLPDAQTGAVLQKAVAKGG